MLDILGVIGLIIAVAAALDFALKPSVKANIGAAISPSIKDMSNNAYKGSEKLDKIFGKNLLSKRSISVSIILSVASLVFSYVYAYVTSDFLMISIFDKSPNLNTIALFLLFLVGCLIGDIISYAQTRVFLRTLDNNKGWTVSTGLAISDSIISLSIFVFIFSLTRLIAYLSIISLTPMVNLERNEYIDTAQLKYLTEYSVASNLSSKTDLGWPILLSNATAQKDEKLANAALNDYTNQFLDLMPEGVEVESKVTFICGDDPKNFEAFFRAPPQTVALLAREISTRRGIPQYGEYHQEIVDTLNKKSSQWTPPKRDVCSKPILKISQKISSGSLLKISGIFNAFYASFERTLYNFYENFGFKLASYSVVEPMNDISLFYDSIIMQTLYGFLGFTQGDSNANYLLSGFSAKPQPDLDRLTVPFSPMLASSLGVSIFFWLYLVWLAICQTAGPVSRQMVKLSERFDVRRAPLSTVGIALTAGLLVFTAARYAVGWIWNAVF
ncbi:hypothetical protein [Sphingopyxis chilensis]|uniref:hypothetical protein n=1 Tax=Sphingopyxis chilensis TaxID=180400 RepID=UPI002DDD2A40|nr:hypothetical protein [Sphingopyxis chilensis]